MSRPRGGVAEARSPCRRTLTVRRVSGCRSSCALTRERRSGCAHSLQQFAPLSPLCLHAADHCPFVSFGTDVLPPRHRRPLLYGSSLPQSRDEGAQRECASRKVTCVASPFKRTIGATSGATAGLRQPRCPRHRHARRSSGLRSISIPISPSEPPDNATAPHLNWLSEVDSCFAMD